MPLSTVSILLGAAVAVPLVLASALPTRAAEPDVDSLLDVGRRIASECDEYETDQWLCFHQDDARYVHFNVSDYGTSMDFMVGRNRFDVASPMPAEGDVLAAMQDALELTLPGDAEAQAWLAEMNAGPRTGGELIRGDWTLTWSAEMVDVVNGVANVTLHGFHLPSGGAPSPAPSGRPTDALEAYLAGYGLTCSDDHGPTACVLELDDGATYEVTTTRDQDGAVLTILALVRSIDASFPSDGIGFLRGVAERAPVDDPAALVTWIDDVVRAGGSADNFTDGGWAAAWADQAVGGGRLVSLTLSRAAAAEPSDDRPPPAPDQGGGRPFADSVPTPTEISTDPVVLLQSAALAALLVFLMPFPGQLFNSTLEAHEDEVRGWFRLDRLAAAVGGIGAFWATWPGVIAFTAIATLLYGFLDPGFGLTARSAATFVGMLLGIVLVTAVFAVPAVLAHRRIGDAWSVKVVPVSLAVGVACVLLSRLTDFQPGYVYGLLVGVVFARDLASHEEGRTTAVSAALMLAVSLAAWVGLGAVPEGDGLGLIVARTALAALMVAGLEGVVFGLLPMRFLPGEPLFAWNRVVWGVLLGIGAFAFFHVLINPASGYLSDTSRTPLLTVLALLIGFGLVSVAFWAWFRFRSEPAQVGPEVTAD